MQSHKFLEIQNPKEETLHLPAIRTKNPSPLGPRVGSDINLIMMPNHKRANHFHLRSRSNAAGTILTQEVPNTKGQTQTPMRSRYREEYDFKSQKYNTVHKYGGRHDSKEEQRMQNGSVQEVMANNLSGKSMGISRNLQDNSINIVPCRWSNNGWKYTVADPTEEKYFRNPNRVNRFGHNAAAMGSISKGQHQSQLIRLAANQQQGSYDLLKDAANQNNEGETHFKSSYQMQFQKKTNNKFVNWQENFQNGEFGAQKNIKELPTDQQLILWGGGMHQRHDFKKKRTENTEFTEVLFRN